MLQPCPLYPHFISLVAVVGHLLPPTTPHQPPQTALPLAQILGETSSKWLLRHCASHALRHHSVRAPDSPARQSSSSSAAPPSPVRPSSRANISRIAAASSPTVSCCAAASCSRAARGKSAGGDGGWRAVWVRFVATMGAGGGCRRPALQPWAPTTSITRRGDRIKHHGGRRARALRRRRTAPQHRGGNNGVAVAVAHTHLCQRV